MSPNYNLIETWLADTSEHTLEDRYVRTVLTGLLVGERRFGRPITPEHVRDRAREESVASDEAPGHSEMKICAAAATVLWDLSRKLHEVSL